MRMKTTDWPRTSLSAEVTALATQAALDDCAVICCVRANGEEATLRTLRAFLILAAAVAPAAPAFAADPFPLSGAAKLAAYSVCRSAVIVDMGPVGSNSSAECTGIVKTLDGSKILDNLAIRCIEEAKARRERYAFSGTCIHTDGDGRQDLHDLRRSGKPARSSGSAEQANTRTSSARAHGPLPTRQATMRNFSRSRSTMT